MSKRFGRNQKRKAREEIAALKAQCSKLWSDLSDSQHRARQAEDAIDNARRILPTYCAVLPPLIVAMGHDSRVANGALRLQTQSRDFRSYSLTDKILQLNALLHSVDVDKLTGALHVRLRYRDDVLSYAATEEAIHTIPAQELACIVADNVAHAVVRKLKG